MVDSLNWIRSYLVAPIFLRDHIIGVLQLDGLDPYQFSTEDADRLKPLANAAAIAIERAQQHQNLQHRAEQLAQARDQALEASRLKSELLAKVSHELRTPLGAILGYAEMIQDGVYGVLTEGQLKPLDEIIESTQFLTKLVNELLDQAQIEAGKTKLKFESFAPKDVLLPVLSKLRYLADAKGLKIETEVADDVPEIIMGDQERIQQILLNLVGNAIKFTQKGFVRIYFRCHDATHWAMQVIDTGPGIPKEALSYIFEPFRQVDGSVTRVHTGTGLGLSIVKDLTHLMGGEILLDSQVGQGSIFTVRLPLVPVQEEFAP